MECAGNGGAGNEDRGGISTATTTPLPSAIVAGRNMLRRRCYGPETSRQELQVFQAVTIDIIQLHESKALLVQAIANPG
jgi:hypothetical protein